MTIRATLIGAALAAALLAGCDEQRSGPIVVSAIGRAPRLVNPNLMRVDPPTALLLSTTAQGLVRFDQTGQIEPAMAQSWIVSDDGTRYTFRLARLEWSPGKPVTAEQVVGRLRAALSRASRNPLKPQLGAIDEIEAMTDDVLEIALVSPRPNFLQLLAQPELAIVRDNAGTGPYRAERQPDGSLLLALPGSDEEDEDPAQADVADFILRGERAALAIARFQAGNADLVTGGTAGDLPVLRQAEVRTALLHFEPVQGLFGLRFVSNAGPLGDTAVRQALSMAIDREALVDQLDVPGLEPRETLVAAGNGELQQPAAPEWAALRLSERRAQAAQTIAASTQGEPLSLRVAMPDQPGYRLVFAHLRRDWRAIGVDARLAGPRESADLRLLDAIAPTIQAAWYMRHFTCPTSPICAREADDLLDSARAAATVEERRQALAAADALLTAATPFIPLTGPVRWTLASQRLTGFRPNLFAQHFPGSLLARRR